MNDPEVLTPFDAGYLKGYSSRNGGTGLGHDDVKRLIASHERLRAMFAEACVRIAKQSDALGKRAEREGV